MCIAHKNYSDIIQSSVRKMLPCQENRDPPTHTLHTHNTVHIMHVYISTHHLIQSSVRKMLPCQENRDPPPPPPTHTHNTLHIHTMCAYTMTCTYSHLSGKFSLVRKIESPPPPPPPHTHTMHALHIHTMCTYIIIVLTVNCQENASLSEK